MYKKKSTDSNGYWEENDLQMKAYMTVKQYYKIICCYHYVINLINFDRTSRNIFRGKSQFI